MLLPRIPSPESEVGAVPPPPGIIANLDHPDTMISKYNILCQVLVYVTVTSCVIARIYTRLFVRPGLKLEDYTCLVAWALAVALSALALSCIKYRGGVHLWEVTERDVAAFLHVQYFGELVYYPAAFLTKTSILCLIARIFSPNTRAVLFSRLLILIMILYYVPAFFIKIFRCRPIHKTWITKAPGKCFTDEASIFLADCIVSLATDVIILVLPMPLVWTLKASLRRKLRIMVVFAGGILAVAAIVARTIMNYTISTLDPTYKVQIIMLLAIAEVNIGIICSCLPILPIFYQHVSRSKDNSKKSYVSSYHRLEAITSSALGIERVKLSRADKEEAEAVVEATNSSKEERATKRGPEGLSVSVLGGAGKMEKSDSFQGGGILKTVDVEQHGDSVSVPERAVLPDEMGLALSVGESYKT